MQNGEVLGSSVSVREKPGNGREGIFCAKMGIGEVKGKLSSRGMQMPFRNQEPLLDDKTKKDTIADFAHITWPEFSKMLDSYRDAAYWAGYEDAKKEWIRQVIDDFRAK
jgi:hypothetical protein